MPLQRRGWHLRRRLHITGKTLVPYNSSSGLNNGSCADEPAQTLHEMKVLPLLLLSICLPCCVSQPAMQTMDTERGMIVWNLLVCLRRAHCFLLDCTCCVHHRLGQQIAQAATVICSPILPGTCCVIDGLCTHVDSNHVHGMLHPPRFETPEVLLRLAERTGGADKWQLTGTRCRPCVKAMHRLRDAAARVACRCAAPVASPGHRCLRDIHLH